MNSVKERAFQLHRTHRCMRFLTKNATVKDLLDHLGYDSLEIVEQHQQLVDTISDCFSSVHL